MGFLETLATKDLKLKYVVLKLGDRVLSTKMGKKPIGELKVQKTVSHTGGTELNIWLKDLRFEEEKHHQMIMFSLPAEINIYYENIKEEKK